MRFNNLGELQTFLDKTGSIEDRFQTTCFLLSGKISELKVLAEQMKSFAQVMQSQTQLEVKSEK